MYTIISQDNNLFQVSYNPEHPIFKAHFPNNPITPGVCLIETSEELLSRKLGKPIRLICLKNSKFISLLDPEKERNVDFQIQYSFVNQQIDVQVIIKTTSAVIAKINAAYEFK